MFPLNYQVLKEILEPFIFLIFGAVLTYFFKINVFQHIGIILAIGSFFLSFSLFANVQSINRTLFEKYKTQSAILVSVGLVFKALLLGLIFYAFTGDVRFFLMAALISQIDPSFTNWAHKAMKIRGKASELTLAESTFDDPVSTLITLYIALPFVLGGSFGFGTYLWMMLLNSFFVVVFFLSRNRIKNSIYSALSIILGSYLGLFLGVAISGLFVKLKKTIFDRPIKIITYLSYFLIGIFIPTIKLEWLVGILFGLLLVLFVRPLEVLIFFNKFSLKDKLVLMFAEQKGITTLLLLLFVQPMVNVLGVIFPAMITINSFFLASNYLLMSSKKKLVL